MTKEEAIELIKEYRVSKAEFSNVLQEQAIDMAIKSLEQQSSDDCVSRERARQFLYEEIDRLNNDELYDIFSRIIDDMYNELPSV